MGLLAAPPGQRQGSRIASTVRQIAPSFGALDALTRSITWDFRSRFWKEERKTALLVATPMSAICFADRTVVMAAHPGRVREIHRVDLPGANL
jgi:ABC-type nitrate/sulfonate/bicarbonate transport system ATPase subunit